MLTAAVMAFVVAPTVIPMALGIIALPFLGIF